MAYIIGEPYDSALRRRDERIKELEVWQQAAIDAMLNFRYDEMVRLVMAELKKREQPVSLNPTAEQE